MRMKLSMSNSLRKKSKRSSQRVMEKKVKKRSNQYLNKRRMKVRIRSQNSRWRITSGPLLIESLEICLNYSTSARVSILKMK